MNMISMEMPKEKGGKSEGCCCSAPCSCDEDKPRYPWGLQLHVQTEQLDQLGIKEMPKVGELMMVQCAVKVTSCSEEEREGSELNRSVSLQIVKMGIEGKPLSSTEKAGALYKSSGMEGGK